MGNAEVNTKKDVGYTALMLAARRGSAKMCNALLLHKNSKGKPAAHIDATDKQGETALSKALKKDRSDVVRLLRSFGASEEHGHPSHGHGYKSRSKSPHHGHKSAAKSKK